METKTHTMTDEKIRRMFPRVHWTDVMADNLEQGYSDKFIFMHMPWYQPKKTND